MESSSVMKGFNTEISNKTCHICGTDRIEWLGSFSQFARVTSDCRQWESGGKLGVCMACRTVIKAIDSAFMAECADIYAKYDVYYQAKGEEQKVFEQQSGFSLNRSEKILSQLLKVIPFEVKGRLLDVGCGNGNLLKTFTKLMPEWLLVGHELNEKYKDTVLGIRNVCGFYCRDLDEITDGFDLITLIHSLEHISNPRKFLESIMQKLNLGGYLLIQVPDYTRNPFDLVIVDHCSHFDPNSISNLLESAGYDLVFVDSIIPKELTIVAVRKPEANVTTPKRLKSGPYAEAGKAISWLQALASDAQKTSAVNRLGIFGTSIAGVWLCNELRNNVGFFVDEDMNRVGETLFGKSIITTASLKQNDFVYLPFPYPYVTQMYERLRACSAHFCLPPE